MAKAVKDPYTDEIRAALALTLDNIRARLVGTDQIAVIMIPGPEPFIVSAASGEAAADLLLALEKGGAVDDTFMSNVLGVNPTGIRS